MDDKKIKDVWLKVFGFTPPSLNDSDLYRHPIWKAATPKVDKIAKEIDRKRAKGREWNPKTQRWEKVEVRQRERINARLPLMPVDMVLELFKGARVVGSELTPQELAMIETETTKGYRDKDGVWHRVEKLDGALRCKRCDKPSVPERRRGGKIVERKWPDGRVELACSHCGVA
jgi:hypothetical protein